MPNETKPVASPEAPKPEASVPAVAELQAKIDHKDQQIAELMARVDALLAQPPAQVPTVTAAAAVLGLDEKKASRIAARKELKRLHKQDRTKPDFDHERFHALHYLAAGKPVPDPEDRELVV